ncbi:unnamed protein product [Linum tenue]|uniref:F-box domain-containing protein n=1 Tax=Linum tenue TaxID=586396 RepID=A0AAV0IHM7_9ROSI|nr:unnamed protein product [Linum tenue]
MMADTGTSALGRQLRSRFLPCSSSKRRRIHSTEANPTTAAAICKLDDDLLVEILIRLPNPRSACRCKLVCKQWSSLIFDPVRFSRRFVSHHRCRNQQQQPPLIILSDDPQSIITSFLPLTTLSSMSFVVLDSYKDLVLCGFPGLGPTSGELYRSYFLCNPFTKQWIALPLAPEWPKETSICFARVYKARCFLFGYWGMDQGGSCSSQA